MLVLGYLSPLVTDTHPPVLKIRPVSVRVPLGAPERANPLRVLRGQVAEARREISCTKGFGPIWLGEGAGQDTRLPVKIHIASVRDRLGALRIASSERLTFAGPS